MNNSYIVWLSLYYYLTIQIHKMSLHIEKMYRLKHDNKSTQTK